MGLILLAGGVFSFCGAAFDWDWFMDHRKTRFFTAIFGRTGARIFYGLLGSGLAVYGTLILLGIAEGTS